jgi:hypothetical protein
VSADTAGDREAQWQAYASDLRRRLEEATGLAERASALVQDLSGALRLKDELIAACKEVINAHRVLDAGEFGVVTALRERDAKIAELRAEVSALRARLETASAPTPPPAPVLNIAVPDRFAVDVASFPALSKTVEHERDNQGRITRSVVEVGS